MTLCCATCHYQLETGCAAHVQMVTVNDVVQVVSQSVLTSSHHQPCSMLFLIVRPNLCRVCCQEAARHSRPAMHDAHMCCSPAQLAAGRVLWQVKAALGQACYKCVAHPCVPLPLMCTS
jgi:hypothetical protein